MSGIPPLLFDASGPIVTPPATLNAALIALVASQVPGYSAQLPGSLVEDISSTAVGALATIDAARVEAVNSVAPGAANPYLLTFFGQQFGLPQNQPSNASVYVVFTGSAGYVIPPGFTVSDGTSQYSIQDGGVIASGDTSSPLYAVATNSNVFAVPPATVTIVATSVPSPYSISVTNPLAGVPAQAAESIEGYRSRLLQASQVALSGTQTYLKTLLHAVPGVAARLVSVNVNGAAFTVVCSGGDPYATANAIYQGVSSIGLLAGSAVSSGRNITVSLYDAPDTYSVVFVSPPQAVVTVSTTWNSNLVNFTSSLVVDLLIVNAVQAYINGIQVGQPINLLVMTEAIQVAIAPVLAPVNLTTLIFAVTINSITATPTAGTSIIPAPDAETYFYISPSGATSAQG
jgi:hypothetical protein